MRYRGTRFVAAGFVLAAALLIVAPAGALAGPGAEPAGSAFFHRQLIKAGSFSELAEAVDRNGKVHIAAGNERDVWYLTNRTGSWTSTKAFVHRAGPDGFFWPMASRC